MSQLAIPNNFFGILLFGPFYECIAVSATSDPLGAYYRYQFSFDKLNDYPKMGVWPDGYYMTMNQYTSLSLQWAVRASWRSIGRRCWPASRPRRSITTSRRST